MTVRRKRGAVELHDESIAEEREAEVQRRLGRREQLLSGEASDRVPQCRGRRFQQT